MWPSALQRSFVVPAQAGVIPATPSAGKQPASRSRTSGGDPTHTLMFLHFREFGQGGQALHKPECRDAHRPPRCRDQANGAHVPMDIILAFTSALKSGLEAGGLVPLIGAA